MNNLYCSEFVINVYFIYNIGHYIKTYYDNVDLIFYFTKLNS